MNLRNIFIENIKFYRKKEGFSQQQLAEKCEIATNYLSEIERGQKFPSVEVIDRLSEELKIPAYLFFMETNAALNNDIIINKRHKKFSEEILTVISNLLKEYKFID